jgi:hypothetical protein
MFYAQIFLDQFGPISGVAAHPMLALSFMFTACLCLVTLRMKVLRRASGKQAHLATMLADSLRSGALEFEGGARSDTPLRHDWMDLAEPEEREMPKTKRIPSRYEMLGYGGKEPETIIFLAPEDEPVAPVRDEDLILGIQRSLLSPDLLESAELSRTGLAFTAGSAAGDEPGKSVPQAHVDE